MKFVIQALSELRANLQTLVPLEVEVPVSVSEVGHKKPGGYDLRELVLTQSKLIDKLIALLQCTTSATAGIYQAKLVAFLKSKEVATLKKNINFPESELLWLSSSPINKQFKVEKPTYLLSFAGLFYLSPINGLNKPVSQENLVTMDPEFVNGLIKTVKKPGFNEVAPDQSLGTVTEEQQQFITASTNHAPVLPWVTDRKQAQLMEYLKVFTQKLSANAQVIISESESYINQFWLIFKFMSFVKLNEVKKQGTAYIKTTAEKDPAKSERNKPATSLKEWFQKNKQFYPDWIQEVLGIFLNVRPSMLELASPFKSLIQSLIARPDPQALHLPRLPEPHLLGQFIENLARPLLTEPEHEALRKATQQMAFALKAPLIERDKISLALEQFLSALFTKKESQEVRQSLEVLFKLLLVKLEDKAPTGETLLKLIPLILARPEYQKIATQVVAVLKTKMYSPTREQALVGLQQAVLESAEYGKLVQSLQELVGVFISSDENAAIRQALQDLIQIKLTQFHEPHASSEDKKEVSVAVKKSSLAERAFFNLLGIFLVMHSKKSPVTNKIKDLFGSLLGQSLGLFSLTFETEIKNYHYRWQQTELHRIEQLAGLESEVKMEQNAAASPLDPRRLNFEIEKIQQEIKHLDSLAHQLTELRKNAARYEIEKANASIKAALLLRYDQVAQLFLNKKKQLERDLLEKKEGLNKFLMGNINAAEESATALAEKIAANKIKTAGLKHESASLLAHEETVSEQELRTLVTRINTNWQAQVVINEKDVEEYNNTLGVLKNAMQDRLLELQKRLEASESEMQVVTDLIERTSADLRKSSESVDQVGNRINLSKHILFGALRKIEKLKLDVLDLEREFESLETKSARFLAPMDLLTQDFLAMKATIKDFKINLGISTSEVLNEERSACSQSQFLFWKKAKFEEGIQLAERGNLVRRIEKRLSDFLGSLKTTGKCTSFFSSLSFRFFACLRRKPEAELWEVYLNEELRPALKSFSQDGNRLEVAAVIQKGLSQFQAPSQRQTDPKSLRYHLEELQKEFPSIRSRILTV